MRPDGDHTDSDQTPVVRQTPAHHYLLIALILTALLISACTGVPTRPVDQVSYPDAESQLPASAAIALRESDGLDALAPDPGIGDRRIWERLRAGFRFRDIDHPRIEHEIERLQRYPNAFRALMARSEPLLYHILNEVDAAGLPTELTLLPAVESGFRPHAYSPDGAVGLWQFMPATANMVGLGRNWWFDERRTVRASTSAAVDFLERLQQRFDGNWLHALAAYNAGTAKVSRAIHRARRHAAPTDFWSLDLPGETDRYIPRLLALARVIDDPDRYGLDLPDIPDRPYFTVARIDGAIDLSIAAQAASMPVDELLGLNAGHRRWATNPEGPFELLLPLDKVETFESSVAALPPEKRLRWKRHTVNSGESLNRIARHYSVDADAIREVNRLHGSLIRAGEELLIPLSDQVNPAVARASQLSRQRLRYRVRKGDSLYEIARRFQVSIKDLKRWNQVGRYIRPGERLTVFVDPDA